MCSQRSLVMHIFNGRGGLPKVNLLRRRKLQECVGPAQAFPKCEDLRQGP